MCYSETHVKMVFCNYEDLYSYTQQNDNKTATNF